MSSHFHTRSVRALALASLLTATDASAGPVRVRVRGTARLDAQATHAGQELVLSGALADDAGQPLAGEDVHARVIRESDPNDSGVADALRAARPCAANVGQTAHVSHDGEVVARTDEGGRFCLVAKLPIDRYRGLVAWNGTPFIDAAKVELPIDLTRRSLALRFDPIPRVVSLDASPFVAEVIATSEDSGVALPVPALAVTMTNESGESLGAGTTNVSGRARFSVDAARLGPPGRGELRVSFAGDADTTSALQRADIERHSRVTLRVPKIEEGALEPESSEDGITLLVQARGVRGNVPDGSIEAWLGDALVGAAPVEAGESRLVVTFSPPPSNEAALRLKYARAAPWFEPSSDLEMKLPVRGPSPLRKAPLAVAALAVIAWLLLGRARRAPLPAAARRNTPEVPAMGNAKIEVVRATRDPRVGWSGQVTDAHEGTPVAGARIAIERPGFRGRAVIASVVANDAGRFELRAPDACEGDELRFEGDLHAVLRQGLPSHGELAVALVLRKRKVLERLVRWARRRGGAFDARPEPTPGHVRRAAGADFSTARWADAVERAAFGGGVVDAEAEAEVERLEPSAAGLEPAGGVAADDARQKQPKPRPGP